VADDHGWWVRIYSKSHWVPDTATLRSWVGDGRLGRSDLVWDPNISQWIRSTDVKELRSQFYPFDAIQTRWRYDAFLVVWPFMMMMFGAVGVVLIAATIESGLLSDIRALTWKNTECRIIRSAMPAEVEHFDNGTTRTRYRVNFQYEYKLGGRRYESSRADFSAGAVDNELLDYADAERVVGRYATGQRVAVYFDPSEPASAVLNRGMGIIVGFFIGIGMTAVATLVLISWWRRRSAIARVRDSM